MQKIRRLTFDWAEQRRWHEFNQDLHDFLQEQMEKGEVVLSICRVDRDKYEIFVHPNPNPPKDYRFMCPG